MTEINPKINSTQAGQIAKQLDKKDGKEDGKIAASIWNEFVADKGGKQIKYSITLENAMKSISTYLHKNANKAGQTVKDLADSWLKKNDSSEVKNDYSKDTSTANSNFNWEQLSDKSVKDWKSWFKLGINFKKTNYKPIADKNNKLTNNMFFEEVKNICNQTNPEEIKTLKSRLDKVLANEWTASRDDVESLLGEYQLAYIVDEKIAEKIDNIAGLDKNDVYDLIVVPLYRRAIALENMLSKLDMVTPDIYPDFSIVKNYKLSKEMSLEEMQNAINEFAKCIKKADNYAKYIENKIADYAHFENYNNARDNDYTMNRVEDCAQIAYGLVNDMDNIEIKIDETGRITVAYFPEDGNYYCLDFTKDSNGNISLEYFSDTDVELPQAHIETLYNMVQQRLQEKSI